MMHTTARVLIVEDEPDIADMLADHITHNLGAETTVARTASEALKLELGHPHDVVLADVLLPDANALDLVRQLRDMSNPQVVLMTGEPNAGRAIEAMRLGVRDMMTKPFDLSHLTTTIRQLLDEQRQQQAKQQRSHRLRALASRIVRERRELRQRLDLLCRDFVHAHQRLAEKVVKDRESADAP